MKKFLIGCEESQTVTIALRQLGHEAYSCDLLPCSGGHPEWHLQMDIYKAIDGGTLQTQDGENIDISEWYFIGLHPVCTKMTLSGNRHYAPNKPRHNERLEAVEWTISLWKYAKSRCQKLYMENPMGAMNTDDRLPVPQTIQPYYFGDPFQKTTCLWLHNLQPLFHSKGDLFSECTHVDKGEMVTFKSGKVMPKWYAETPSTNSEKNRGIRSKTYPGIAKAIAEQWTSNFI